VIKNEKDDFVGSFMIETSDLVVDSLDEEIKKCSSIKCKRVERNIFHSSFLPAFPLPLR
jgi:hypothetical protein